MDPEPAPSPTEEHPRLAMTRDRSADLRAAHDLGRRNLVLGLWLLGFCVAVLALTAIIAVLVVYG